MQDALLVVDSNRQVILTNQTFRKLFDAPEISLATPLLEIVRDPTLDRLLTDAFRGDGPVRCELTLDTSQIELHAVATKNDAGEITFVEHVILPRDGKLKDKFGVQFSQPPVAMGPVTTSAARLKR